MCLSHSGIVLKRQMQVGWVKIGHFRRKKHYNSKTVQNRRIVSIKVEYEVIYALCQMAMFPTTLVFAFFVAFDIFVVGQRRDFKFGTQVGCS